MYMKFIHSKSHPKCLKYLNLRPRQLYFSVGVRPGIKEKIRDLAFWPFVPDLFNEALRAAASLVLEDGSCQYEGHDGYQLKQDVQ